MKVPDHTNSRENMAKLREAKATKAKLALEPVKSNKTSTGRDQRYNKEEVKRTPIRVNSTTDVRKLAKDMMASLANKDGRFSSAEVRVFNALVNVYFKADEQITLKREALRRIKEAHRDNE